jgi:putative glycosyltransferase (TIGR04372 family)
MKLTDFIISQGGQVVRIGHPQMTRFPEQEGFIDLAQIEDQFMLQAHAVGRARFMIGSLTGTSHLGSAMNTPTAITNCVDPPYVPGCWRDHDVVLNVSCFDRDGRRITVRELIESGDQNSVSLSHRVKSDGWTVKQNSPAQLVAVAKELMETTADCTA